MLSNAYFLAKFGFDTAENEPAKILQNLQKIAHFAAGSERAGARPWRTLRTWKGEPFPESDPERRCLAFHSNGLALDTSSTIKRHTNHRSF